MWGYFEDTVAKASITFQVNVTEETVLSSSSTTFSRPTSIMEFETMLCACAEEKSVSEVCPIKLYHIMHNAIATIYIP